jgi:integrase
MELRLEEGIASQIEVPKGARDVLVFDTQTPGFFLRKFASGRAMYGVKYSVAGKPRRVHLHDASIKGALAKARKEAGDVRAKARLGTDVVADRDAKIAATKAEAAQQANTMGSLIETYLKACETRKKPMRPKTIEETSRHLNVHWKPLHKKPLASIAKADLIAGLNTIEKDNGVVACDRARSAISGLFSWAIMTGLVENSPTVGLQNRANGGGRDRVLTGPELVEVWRGVEAVGGDYEKIVKLLILTGQRKTEIGGLSWPEIEVPNAAAAQINLPPERVKNGKRHLVPLTKLSLGLLPARRNRTDMVFGQRDTGFSGWSKSKALLDAEILAARQRRDTSAKPMVPWTVHDIRRSFATGISEAGFAQPHIVEAILNHISGFRASVAGVYNHAVYLKERQEALEAWEYHIERLLSV